MIRLSFVGVLLIVVYGCSTEERPTYKHYGEFYQDPSNEFISAFHKIPDPELEIEFKLDSSWNFTPGNPAEGFETGSIDVNGDPVNLPHRVLMPDTPLWYSKIVKITKQGVLTIRADDGAQLFINKKRIRRLAEIHFPVDTTGDILITIRVLNNAMAGGLHSVSLSTREQFQKFENESLTKRSLKTLVMKTVLMNSPSLNCVTLVKEALIEQSIESIKKAEECFKSFPYLTGPYLIRKDSQTMIVKVRSENAETVSLQWGKHNNLINSITGEGFVASFELTNLEPGKTYSYQLRCNQTVSPIYSFTLEDEANDYSFNVWADSQSGWEAFASQVHLLKKHDDAFGVGAGDLVGNGSDQEEWETFFSILSESASERPYYLVPGNHDYDGYYDDLKPVFYNEYTGYDPSNYFSWSYGNAAFIALDPNENFPIGIPENSEQYLWLQDQLKTESWKHAQWRFVFLHQTLYSQGWQGYHGDSVLRDVLEPLIESGKIDFIISGHTHDYERLSKQYGEQEVTFLVVGGAGGSLEAKGSSTSPVMDVLIKQHHMGRFYLYDDSLRFEAIGMDGQLLDSFKRFKKL